MQGKRHTAESRAKMAEVQRAIGNAPEERAARSERARARGYGKWMAGRTASVETRAAIGRAGSKSYEERYGDRAEEEREKRRQGNRARWEGVERKKQRDRHNGDHRYGEWRRAVFTRDDYTCRSCGERGGVLHAHHVRSWAKHPEARYDVTNGVTLHEACHREHHAALRRGDAPTL